MSNKRRRFSKGDNVQFRGQRWVVCEGGFSDPVSKSYKYKISRGAWKKEIAGNRLSVFSD